MNRLILGLMVSTLSCVVCDAYAGSIGRSTSSVTSSRAAAFVARPSIQRSVNKAASSPRTQSAAAAPSQNSSAQPMPPASPVLSEKIRQQSGGSSTGSGLVTLAVLYALLHDNGLSASDRAWVESRIHDSEATDAVEPPAEPLKIEFYYSFSETEPQVGIEYEVRVDARQYGQSISVSCDFMPGKVRQEGNQTVITWTPWFESKQVLTCNAGGRFDQRLIQVSGRSS